VDLYIHSPIRLHGVVLNWLSTGTTVPYHLRLGLPNGLFSSFFHKTLCTILVSCMAILLMLLLWFVWSKMVLTHNNSRVKPFSSKLNTAYTRGGNCEEYILDCGAVKICRSLRRIACCLLGLLFRPEDGDSTFL
jgi:hypothetical protein